MFREWCSRVGYRDHDEVLRVGVRVQGDHDVQEDRGVQGGRVLEVRVRVRVLCRYVCRCSVCECVCVCVVYMCVYLPNLCSIAMNEGVN